MRETPRNLYSRVSVTRTARFIERALQETLLAGCARKVLRSVVLDLLRAFKIEFRPNLGQVQIMQQLSEI